jgi:hypothetical protein
LAGKLEERWRMPFVFPFLVAQLSFIVNPPSEHSLVVGEGHEVEAAAGEGEETFSREEGGRGTLGDPGLLVARWPQEGCPVFLSFLPKTTSFSSWVRKMEARERWLKVHERCPWTCPFEVQVSHKKNTEPVTTRV